MNDSNRAAGENSTEVTSDQNSEFDLTRIFGEAEKINLEIQSLEADPRLSSEDFLDIRQKIEAIRTSVAVVLASA